MEVKQKPINNKDLQKFTSHCHTFKDYPLSMLEPYHQVYPSFYMDHHKSFQEAEVYEDGVWICTFPKSGILLISLNYIQRFYLFYPIFILSF